MKRKLLPATVTVLLAACASLTSPNGGPKDVTPPAVTASTPEPNQLNFKGNVLEFEFDEYVQLKNPKEEIIISPSPGREIDFKVKGNKVTITPKNGWRDSTTYSLQFREGILDLTEKNAPQNLKLAFSTGPVIDSLRLAGTVTETLKGTEQENITVAIFNQDTFDIFTDAPNYFTKTDKTGKFNLTNIKEGSYRIYAFDDKNKNLKVESRSERFGFLTDTLVLKSNIDTISIGLVRVDSRPLKINSIRNAGSVSRLRFNKPVLAYTVKADSGLVHAFAETQDEVVFYNPPGDSLRLELSATDSVGFSIDSSFYIKKTNQRTITENFKWSLGRPAVESETGKFSTTLSFNKPVETLNFDSLFIEVDTLTKVPITQRDVVFDLPHKLIAVSRELSKEIFKGEKDPILKLQAGQGFVHTIESDTSKRLSTPVAIIWPENTGVLFITVTASTSNYIVELVQDSNVVGTVKNASKHTFKNLAPGDYQLRVILDVNQNGKWDPGNIYRGEEPEKIIFYRAANGKLSFPVRANWELGPLLVRF